MNELIAKLKEIIDWADLHTAIDTETYLDYVKYVDGKEVYVDESDLEGEVSVSLPGLNTFCLPKIS